MLRNENFSAPGYHARCASQTQHSRPFVSTQPPLVHRQWSVDVPKAITIPLSVQATPQCLDVGGRAMPWISLVLISRPSRPTIPHFCAMWITRSGTIVIWGKWDVQSPTLPLYSYHFTVKCMWIRLPKWTTQPFATELPCHLPFLFSCMWQCLCNSIAILKLIVLSKCDLLSNGSMTIALIATCTIYICES